jgi:hypothetical protein
MTVVMMMMTTTTMVVVVMMMMMMMMMIMDKFQIPNAKNLNLCADQQTSYSRLFNNIMTIFC